MKKILLGIVTTIVVLAMAITSVNAATVDATKEVKKGDKVTVTVKLDNPNTKLRATVSYDASKFEYVKESAKADDGSTVVENAQNAGTVTASAATTKTVQTMTFTFIAKETTDAANFTVSNLNPAETIDPATVTVKVVEGKTDDTTPVNPTPNPTPTPAPTPDPVKPGQPKEEKPKVIPQAGVPYIALITVGMAVVAVVAVKKIVK